MKQEYGRIIIKVMVDIWEDEDGDVTIRADVPPSLECEIDLPMSDSVPVAIGFMRKVSDQLEKQFST